MTLPIAVAVESRPHNDDPTVNLFAVQHRKWYHPILEDCAKQGAERGAFNARNLLNMLREQPLAFTPDEVREIEEFAAWLSSGCRDRQDGHADDFRPAQWIEAAMNAGIQPWYIIQADGRAGLYLNVVNTDEGHSLHQESLGHENEICDWLEAMGRVLDARTQTDA